MKINRQSYLNTKRDAWVEINLGYIEHNVLEMKRFLKKDSKLMAVVKADAYGCGAVMIAPVLLASGVDFLGVSSIDEGVQLRESSITAPILVLGAVPGWAFDFAVQNNITLSIFSKEHIDACRLTFEKTGIKPKVHIKVDTGMNRIGICVDDAVEFIKSAQNADFIELEGIFTHFACAENFDKTNKQIKKWNKVINQVDTNNLFIHVANTAALLGFKDIKYNMTRVGIAIYGQLPELVEGIENIPNLKPVISLKGRITNIHKVKANEGVSYSHTFITQKDTTVATVPIGYADGVFRGLSNKIQGSLNGILINQIGNITMDQMMFDITGLEAKTGDIITLLGTDKGNFLEVDNWAKLMGTISYEILCKLKARLSRVYTR